MTPRVINILSLIEDVGIDKVNSLLADFTTKCSEDDEPLNPDIEIFLKRDAIQFAREKKSVTYLVFNIEDGSLVAFYTLAMKAIEIPPYGFSKSFIKRVERFTQIHPVTSDYIVSAYLIAQLSKNYNILPEKRISGNDLMALVQSNLNHIQQSIGGGIVYLDCETNAKLISFYEKQSFMLFGERISKKDGKHYLQYMKFI